MHADYLVVGDGHGRRGIAPGRGLLRVDAQFPGPLRMAFRQVGGAQQVPLGHQVGVDVVVGDGAVLVRAGDPVDVEPPLGIMVAERAPQPRGLREQFHPWPPGEILVAGGVDIADHRVGDVRVDVEGGGARGPVTRAFLAGDRPPREGGALESELCGPLDGHREGAVPPPQRAGRRVGGGQGQHRQDEALGIPEGVPVIPGPGQPLRPGSAGSRRGRRPAGRGTARSAPPAGPRYPRPPPRRRWSQKSSRYAR